MKGQAGVFTVAVVVILVALAWACGGGIGSVETSPGVPATPGRPAAAGNLCDLLPKSDIEAVTGVKVGQVQEHKGPGFLHFCTIYLNVAGCEQCALSLSDLGKIEPNKNNDYIPYRETLILANPDARPTFKDNVVGAESWLATATAGEASGLKILYFKVRDVAYDLTSPRVKGGLLTEDQMIKLAEVVNRRAR